MVRVLKNLIKFFMGKSELFRRFVRQAQFLVWKNRVRLRGKITLRGYIDPHRTLWVRTDNIRYACEWGPSLYKKFGDRGKVKGGSWDKKLIEFEELDIHRGFVDHFVHGKPWEQTEYYNRVLGQIQSGFHKRGMKDQEDLNKRVAYLDRLYEKIKTEGYKPMTGVGDDRIASYAGDEDEICVRIGRDGDLLFEDGRHRLSIAKILGVEKLPVKVSIRHSKWFAFMQEVFAYAKQNKGKLYNVISHPDLDNIPALHGWDRFEMIEANLPFRSGTVLDIGCHWGFYCHQLEKLGFDCVGVEMEPRHIYFLKKLKRAENRRFEIVEGSVFDYVNEEMEFDLVLALYIFHHFIKTEELYNKLVQLLARLKMKAMIFGCHNQDQEAMQTAYRNYSPQEFADFIIEHSNLTRAKHIGTEAGRRELYLLEA